MTKDTTFSLFHGNIIEDSVIISDVDTTKINLYKHNDNLKIQSTQIGTEDTKFQISISGNQTTIKSTGFESGTPDKGFGYYTSVPTEINGSGSGLEVNYDVFGFESFSIGSKDKDIGKNRI